MDLRGHLSQHRINDSPYVCKVRSCEFRASQRMNLFDHYSQMHRDTTLLCWNVKATKNAWQTSTSSKLQIHPEQKRLILALLFEKKAECFPRNFANRHVSDCAASIYSQEKVKIPNEEEGLVFSFSNEDIKHLPRCTNAVKIDITFKQCKDKFQAVPAIKKSVKLIDAKREGQAKLQMQQNKGHLQQSGKPSPSFSLIVDISKHPMHMATDLSQKIEAIWMGQGGQRGGRFDILQAIRSPVVQAALKHLEVVPTHRPDARSFTIGSFAGSANEVNDFVNQLVTRGAARGLALDDKPVKLHIGPEELEQNMIAAREGLDSS
ncbi:unnamed protein product, partial [Mesorhabditis spiculigera]